MRVDAAEYARKCDACQRSAPMIHQPTEPLYPIISLWPFMTWGMDIVGPLPRVTGNRIWMLAMTDYFSKWVEVEAFTKVKDKQVISFIKRNIIYSPVFGAEAVIPSEVLVPTHKYGCMTEELNNTEMVRSLDTVDELQASAKICLTAYKQSVAKSYNKNVKLPGTTVALLPHEMASGTSHHPDRLFCFQASLSALLWILMSMVR
ncbi:uncharacterized protein LOC141607888 [Silene latifolia]|uniref:uncharacterized protein LOC141607888 n=1 Tax=Silene latifolia TaxID=37657 RepID=UPI003D7733E5